MVKLMLTLLIGLFVMLNMQGCVKVGMPVLREMLDVPPSHLTVVNNHVYDDKMKLMWQYRNQRKGNYSTAYHTCQALNLDGYNDWRIPTKNELRTITSHSYYKKYKDVKGNPFYAVFAPFKLVGNEHIWTSSQYKRSYSKTKAYAFGVGYHGFSSYELNVNNQIWCVRGPQHGESSTPEEMEYWVVDEQKKSSERAEKRREIKTEKYAKYKNIGDYICKDGRMALGLIGVTVKGYVRSRSGNEIQIQIHNPYDTGKANSQPYYKGKYLKDGVMIWDYNSNWKHCN